MYRQHVQPAFACKFSVYYAIYKVKFYRGFYFIESPVLFQCIPVALINCVKEKISDKNKNLIIYVMKIFPCIKLFFDTYYQAHALYAPTLLNVILFHFFSI